MKFIHFLFILAAVSACSKSSVDEPGPDPNANNLPPANFTITVDSVNSKRALLTWQGALDPEGDVVVYDIYLNDKLIAKDTTNVPFELTGLKELTSYSGKIVAKDTKNKKTEAAFSFTTEKYYLTFFKSFPYGATESEFREGDARKMIKLSDGNYLVVGAFYTHIPNRNDTHIFAFKFDYEGNTIWKKTYPYATGVGVAVSECSDGVLLTSLFNLFKIDLDGNLLWHKRVANFDDNDGGTEIRSVKGDTEGNIYVVGGRVDSHPDRLQEAVIVKLDASGNTIWERAVNNTLYSFFYDLRLTSSNELLAFGMREGNGITYQQYLNSEPYQSDFWLVKFSTSGDVIWQQSYGDTKNDIPGELIVRSNGNYVFAGSSQGTAYDLQGRIFEVTPDGTELWNTSFGPPLCMILGVAETQDGGLITTGFADLGSTTMWTLHKFNSARSEEWEHTFQLFGSILFGRTVLADEDGGYRIAVSETKYAGWVAPPHLLLYKTTNLGKIY